MVQVAVCDPFDDTKFHPTDKIIVIKHRDTYYALGAFCGFDYSSLAKGALIGEKLICPTCTSTYDIKNGFIDAGPTLRNISSFNI
jgi:nitrite reductase/ring-hydroxylating ferredoxin subunit